MNYKYFLDFDRTRSIYSNDTVSNSTMVPTGPEGDRIEPFYYTVTNTPSLTETFAAGGVFPADAKKHYWTTGALAGQPWNSGDLGKTATSNANSY